MHESRFGAGDRVVMVDEQGRDLVNDDGSPRTMEKLEAHRRGVLHRAVSVFVFDGELVLLQKRALDKYHSAGLWTNACCTHPRPGEASIETARRRLLEEMGIRCPLVELYRFSYRAEVAPDLVEHEYDHVFAGRWSGTPVPDPREVAAWRWVSARELEAEIAREPQAFTYWLKHALGEALERSVALRRSG